MNATTLTIKNRHGVELSTTLEFPTNQKANHIAIFSHCFTCNSNTNAVRNINRALNKNGFAVVRFDFTGLGKSTGDFEDSHFEANVEDLQDVHAYITKHYFAPELIIGHSLGGSAAIVAAALIPELKAVCTIGSPADIEHTTKHFKDQLAELSETGKTTVQIGGRDFVVNQNFVNGFRKHDLPAIIKSLNKPILIFHSPTDEVVAITNAQKIYESATHPKSFISLDTADHLLTQREDSLYVGNVISSWVRRYLPKKQEPNHTPNQHQLVAYLNGKEDAFTTTINTKNNSVITDEPKENGGDDFGFSPYELVTSGLAACTAMTVNMYAKRKQWNLDEVKVYLTHHKEKEGTKMVDIFTKELEFSGDLNESQKMRLVQIAAKCPVHKTLSNTSSIETTMKK